MSQIIKWEIYIRWDSVNYLSLSATARYDGWLTNESNLLFMLGRARGNKMKYPNTNAVFFSLLWMNIQEISVLFFLNVWKGFKF